MGIKRIARSIALTAAAGALSLPGVASADLAIHHYSTSVSRVGGDVGMISPGDSLSVTETVSSSEPGVNITGLNGLLSSATPNVSVPQPTSSFPDLAFAGTSADSTPFSVQLDPALDCGQNVNLSLGLQAQQGNATVPFSIGTGLASAPDTYDAAGLPLGIPDASTLTSTLPIAAAGRVKAVAVHIERITHPFDGDLRISLIAPDGTRVLLVNQRGGSSQNFVDTVLTAGSGAPVATASGPFTGTYVAEGDLSKMIGVQEQGDWKLEVQDMASGNIGTLDSWGLEISHATCAQQPIASFTATPNPALPGQTVQFDASGSQDPVGTINDYQWDLDGNGTFETDTFSDPTTTSVYANRGAYPVSLKVTDDNGHTNVYTRNISVSHPPSAALSASPLSPLSGQTVTLDASGSSDPDGQPIADYRWDLDDDGFYETDTGTVAQTTTTFATPGIHKVYVMVTDSDGATASTERDIAVQNRLPTASIGAPGLVVLGQSVTLDASGSTDPDGTIVAYDWDFDGSSTYQSGSGMIPTRSHTFTVAGMTTVGLRVTDSDGGTATKAITFNVDAPPVASLSMIAVPNPPRPSQSVVLDASGSYDPDGTALDFKWDLDGNGTFETDTGSAATASRSWTAPGSYTVNVEVTDADGVSTTASQVVSVVNKLPVPAVSVVGGEAIAGTPVALDASASTDPDGTVVRYQWDLDGNGTFETDTGSTATVTRTYPNAATIPLKLRVTDDNGGIATLPFSLVVRAPASGGTGGGSTTGAGATGAGAGTATGTTSGTGATGGTGGTGGSFGTGVTALGDFSAGLSGAPIQARMLARRRGLTLTCTSDRAMRCAVTATIDASTARKLRLAHTRKAATVGKVVVDVPAGGDGRFVLKLTSRARKALKRAGRVRILLKGTAVDTAGNSYALARLVLLR